ncbi:MAG: hypothetical protein CR993_06130 [Rhodobacterales bacterium]|nr:MAG: hypothetical protein CR993_06130 [Rhodobacterales bacterium]
MTIFKNAPKWEKISDRLFKDTETGEEISKMPQQIILSLENIRLGCRVSWDSENNRISLSDRENIDWNDNTPGASGITRSIHATGGFFDANLMSPHSIKVFSNAKENKELPNYETITRCNVDIFPNHENLPIGGKYQLSTLNLEFACLDPTGLPEDGVLAGESGRFFADWDGTSAFLLLGKHEFNSLFDHIGKFPTLPLKGTATIFTEAFKAYPDSIDVGMPAGAIEPARLSEITIKTPPAIDWERRIQRSYLWRSRHSILGLLIALVLIAIFK